MTKMILSVAVLVFVNAAFAMPITGPWAQFQIGEKNVGTWAQCQVMAGLTTIENADGVVTLPNTLAETDLAPLIQKASEQFADILAVHVIATEPEQKIYAGIFPELQQYLLYRDASDITGRLGEDAAQLVSIVQDACATIEAK